MVARMLGEGWRPGAAAAAEEEEQQEHGVGKGVRRTRWRRLQLDVLPPPHAGWAPAPPLADWGRRGQHGGFPGLLARWRGWNKGPEGDSPLDPWDRGRQ